MIYSEHIEECNTFAQESPANLKRCCLFVLATIQQQLETVPVALTDIAELAEGSRFAWGPKLKGVTWLESETRVQLLFDEAHSCIDSPVELLDVFLQVPGFALVKAGFACQIFAGSVGCIDTHNVTLYGISAETHVMSPRSLTHCDANASAMWRYAMAWAGLTLSGRAGVITWPVFARLIGPMAKRSRSSTWT